MKKINIYILEKLKVNKDAKATEINTKYKLHEDPIVDNILYVLNMEINQKAIKEIELWIKNNNIPAANFIYIDDSSYKKLNPPDDIIHKFSKINTNDLLGFIKDYSKKVYADNDLVIYTSSYAISFHLIKKDIYLAFRKN